MTAELAVNKLQQRLTGSLILVAIAYVGILAIITWANVNETTGSISRWLFQSIPLLIVLPGMVMLRFRAFSWLCFITIMYFIPGVLEVMSEKATLTDSLFLACTVVIFIAGGFTSRWLQRYLVATRPNGSQ